MPDLETNEQRTVQDVLESHPKPKLETASEQQIVLQLVTVHLSLATINVVHDGIIAMDLQKCPSIIPQRQTQKPGQRTP